MIEMIDPAACPETDESRRCQFCEYRGKLTGEHIWPAQYQQITPGVQMGIHNIGNMENPTERQWRGRAFGTKVRIDCGRCNHEHLRRIEDDALPYIAYMAANLGTATLQADAQRKVAAFAFRMFAVAQYTDPTGRPIPRRHREHLITHRSPPQRVEIWALGYSGTHDRVHVQANAARLAGPFESLPDRANSYRGILRFGRLILEMAAMTDGRPFPFLPLDERIYLRLWPIEINRVGIWPPDRMLNEAGWQSRVAQLSQNYDAIRL